MEGKTHRLGGVLCALIGYSVLDSKGLLIDGVNPLLQLTVFYPFALYGSVVSDLDHGWQSAPEKDPVSFVINKVLHLTTGIRKKTGRKVSPLGIFDAKHRSWQTHSDLFLAVLVSLFVWMLNGSADSINGVIFRLVATGFIMGVISHLILDSLTPEGIWFIIPSIIRRKKVAFRLVPKSKFFSTGGSWESLVRFLIVVAIIVVACRIIYLASPYRVHFNF